MVDGKEIDGALAVLSRNPKLGVGVHLDLCPAIGFYNVPYQKMRENLRSEEGRRTVARAVERQNPAVPGLRTGLYAPGRAPPFSCIAGDIPDSS